MGVRSRPATPAETLFCVIHARARLARATTATKPLTYLEVRNLFFFRGHRFLWLTTCRCGAALKEGLDQGEREGGARRGAHNTGA